MSNTIRIRTTPGGADQYINVDINRDFDYLEVLSLRVSSEEFYRKYCAEYGAVVGRVIVNNGYGVPNVKVSLFLPLSDDDKELELWLEEQVNPKESYKMLPFDDIKAALQEWLAPENDEGSIEESLDFTKEEPKTNYSLSAKPAAKKSKAEAFDDLFEEDDDMPF